MRVAPDEVVRVESLELESTFRDAKDIAVGSHQYAAYDALFLRVSLTGAAHPTQARTTHVERTDGGVATSGATAKAPAHALVSTDDRMALRHVREQQFAAWDIARGKARIFRNILTSALPFLVIVLVVLAAISWTSPSLISLRTANDQAQSTDAALVMTLGAFGGLLSAVATVRSLRGFQRSYGLPLAQSLLKIPAGAATAFAGIFLLQDGLLGSVKTTDWKTTLPYALIFGVAQIGVTRKIDSRAADLLGDVNTKAPVSISTTTSSTGSD
jgi:hypothetical protein